VGRLVPLPGDGGCDTSRTAKLLRRVLPVYYAGRRNLRYRSARDDGRIDRFIDAWYVRQYLAKLTPRPFRGSAVPDTERWHLSVMPPRLHGRHLAQRQAPLIDGHPVNDVSTSAAALRVTTLGIPGLLSCLHPCIWRLTPDDHTLPGRWRWTLASTAGRPCKTCTAHNVFLAY
jgi:hypothetical protein